MKNQLTDQSLQASAFIQEAWPQVFKEAQEVFSTFSGEIDEIIICGCGDSHHAAVGLEVAFDLWTRRGIRAAPAMFASRYLIPRLRARASRCLVIGISASGEIARTVEALQLAKAVGATTVAFTSNRSSSLGKVADGCLSIKTPSYTGPGLLGYLASLLMGYATCGAISEENGLAELLRTLDEIPSKLDPWILSQQEFGAGFAEDLNQESGCVFIAGGSLFGSALFSAAKAIESAGIHAWAQELEEWAHLEYFCEPAAMPTWFLSSSGRTASRENELIEAAKTLGRKIHVSRWQGGNDWSSRASEALAPLALWAGPTALAVSIAEKFGEQPFRGFGGGRSVVEGGGASRIRSSERIFDLRDFEE